MPFLQTHLDPGRIALRQYLGANETGRDFYVGDIQGHLGILEKLLEKVAFNVDADRLIAVGDLVDRGPDSAGVLDFFEASGWFYSVAGNHDRMALACLAAGLVETDQRGIWTRNGGGWDIELTPEERENYARILANLPLTMEVAATNRMDRTGVIHGDIALDTSWQDLLESDDTDVNAFDDLPLDHLAIAFWGRSRLAYALRSRRDPSGEALTDSDRRRIEEFSRPVPGIDTIICGHTRVTHPHEPHRFSNFLYLDTGVDTPGGCLSLAEPASNRWWQLSRTGRDGTNTFNEGELPRATDLPIQKEQ